LSDKWVFLQKNWKKLRKLRNCIAIDANDAKLEKMVSLEEGGEEFQIYKIEELNIEHSIRLWRTFFRFFGTNEEKIPPILHRGLINAGHKPARLKNPSPLPSQG